MLFTLQVFGSLFTIGLEVGSLLMHVAYLLEMRSAWCFRGGIDASISRAAVGVALNAAQISLRVFLCTFSSGFAWHFSVVPPRWACIQDSWGDT